MDRSASFSFDGWTLRRDSGELSKLGQTIRLQDQPLRILEMLLERPGEVVTREELIARLWPKGVVDFETSLNTAVRKLRQALGDDAETPRYIETLPRRGYRFIGTLDAPREPNRGEIAPLSALELARPNNKHRVIVGALVVLAALVAALWWRSTSRDSAAIRAPAADSLAVLPFKPLLADQRNAALELGMTDTLITRLSNLPGVKVSPLAAVRAFDAVDQDPLGAGQTLDVDTVLDGSIQFDRERIRVSARLLRVPDGQSLWAEQFDEPMRDLFAVQDAIAEHVVAALAVRLSPAAKERLLSHSTTNANAYQLYVSGLYNWQRRLPQAVEDFEGALRLDPNYALAWVGLAAALTAQGVFGYEPPEAVFPRAKEAALKAMELDARLASAHAALGHVLVQYERRFAEGERRYLAALALDENDAATWQRLALVRSCLGRNHEALADMGRAQQLEPTTLPYNANIGLLLYLDRDYDGAIAQLERVVAMEPRFDHARSVLGRALIEKGQIDAAIEQFQARTQPSPGSEGDLGRAYARAGRVSEARAEIERLKERAGEGFGVAYDLATIHAALGDMPRACEALRNALADHSQLIGMMRLDPAIDALRGEACFGEVQGRLYSADQ
jgi:serine/threonine-protein kinase